MGRIAHSIFLIFLTIAFSGCVRPGLTYREYMATSLAPADAKARFIVFRPKDAFLEKLHAGARATRVKIDGQVAGYLRGGFKTFEVSAGEHTISVDLWNTPGSCQLEIDTMAGIEFWSERIPRSLLRG
jgi:hypothetical protein